MRRFILSLLACSSVLISSDIPCIKVDMKEVIEKERNKEWENMIWAICQVESRNDDNAKSTKSSALGRFQMLRIYVDEVNRILGKKKYKYDDRRNPVKAREMFDILQGHHNPERDIDKAITIHRGLKSSSYAKKVKREMKIRAI